MIQGGDPLSKQEKLRSRWGTGGAGVQVAIAGPAADTTGVGGLNPGPGEYQWYGLHLRMRVEICLP